MSVSMRTLLFTDIEGATALVDRLGDRYADLLEQHHEIIRRAVRSVAGTEQGTEGDSFFVTFESSTDAMTAAVSAQRELTAATWPSGSAVRVRMGLHIGEVLDAQVGPIGRAIHHAARIASSAHGGQIVVSEAVRATARQLPEDVELTSLGSHALRDVGIIELFQVRHPELISDFPPLRSLNAGQSERWASTLPVQLSSFVGRARELAAVRDLLGSNRLTTLTGPGGAGKTRLALEVVGHIGDVEGLVSFANLAPLTDPSSVIAEVANALSIMGTLDRPLQEIFAPLRDRDLVLVVDNCEHLLDTASLVVEALLSECSHARVLATSRAPLALPGEAVYRVPGMIGSYDEDPDESDAVRLFCERASSQRFGFVLDDATKGSVVSICRKLDGLPLAIELAASRLGSMSLVDIERRLDDRFQLLTGGSRSADARQRTLQAMIDWSYDLLTPPEASLFIALAVFRGGWTLDAVEGIVPSSIGVADAAALNGLLVDKSLVHLQLTREGGRYGFLESVAAYARQRFDASGDDAITGLNQRHLLYYLDLSERLHADRNGADRAQIVRTVATEIENLYSALDWCVERRLAEPGLRLARAIGWSRMRADQRFDRGVSTLLGFADDCDPALRAKAHIECGYRATFQSVARREFHIAQALQLARLIDDQLLIAEALHSMTYITFLSGDIGGARSYSTQSYEAAQANGSALMIGVTGYSVAWMLVESGQLAEGEAAAINAERRALDAGDALRTVTIGFLRACIEYLNDNVEGALDRLYRSMPDANTDPSGQHTTTFNTALGVIHATAGDVDEALDFLGRAMHSASLEGEVDIIGLCIVGLAVVAAHLDDSLRAAQLLGMADRRLEDAHIAFGYEPYRTIGARTRESLRSALSDTEFDEAYELGRAQSSDMAMQRSMQLVAHIVSARSEA